MQWIFMDFQELNPAVYYFCLFILFLKILSIKALQALHDAPPLR